MKILPEDGMGALWRWWWILGEQEEEKVPIAVASIRHCGSGILWSRAWSFLLGFSGAAQGENPFLVKVTVGHTCSNLPEAASGDFGHTAKWQKMFPSSAVETHCSCGSSSGDGAFWNQKLRVDGHDGCWPESLISKLLITNCYYSLINIL